MQNGLPQSSSPGGSEGRHYHITHLQIMLLPSIDEITDSEFICVFKSSNKRLPFVNGRLHDEHVQSMSGKATIGDA